MCPLRNLARPASPNGLILTPAGVVGSRARLPWVTDVGMRTFLAAPPAVGCWAAGARSPCAPAACTGSCPDRLRPCRPTSTGDTRGTLTFPARSYPPVSTHQGWGSCLWRCIDSASGIPPSNTGAKKTSPSRGAATYPPPPQSSGIRTAPDWTSRTPAPPPPRFELVARAPPLAHWPPRLSAGRKEGARQRILSVGSNVVRT
jgi:hypothetical protein